MPASSGALPSDLAASPPTATAVKVNTGATLIIADAVQADIGSLAGGGSVQIGTADATTTLFIGAGSPATTTFSGAITGPGSLELDGGSLTLTGAGNNIGGDFDGVCLRNINGLTIKGGVACRRRLDLSGRRHPYGLQRGHALGRMTPGQSAAT